MKVYFKKTSGVARVTEERDSKPYASTTEYRKNLSELNAEEQREFEDWSREQAELDQTVEANCLVCGKVMGKMAVRKAVNAYCGCRG